jgi:hypothetical protein
MKIKFLFASGIILVALIAVFPYAMKQLTAMLSGYEEVPAISTAASGVFRAQISRNEREISYTLSYSALEGDITQSHIHLGQPNVNGGISVFLCSNLPNPPAGTQACPPPPATIAGTIRATDVIGPEAQGIARGEFAELIQAIRAGQTYVNVHTTKFPGGEVRSQIDPGEEHTH